ncbi:FAD-dependent oxidoreductase [Mycolicibacterium goodii]|uniref:NAD(P)/FAD-dependent oxidoreductase n=1 Tax=Mycolicibacterium goodii TaxID=134601 RepID=UPI001BDD8868|nr:FAD-dependent oxidoreductase [Mycolicibacterium goodii]MBU8819652.1 FAD-dependent oxidoreductase [Mycolicibacterium goodii]
MSESGVLVVGGGQAACQLAVSLREMGYDLPITIVGEEPHSPYQRPPLSKAFLAGKADITTLAFRSDDYYQRQGVRVVTGQQVVAFSMADKHHGGSAHTDSGEDLPFSNLVLAVGAAARKLDVPGSDMDGILTLRDVADATEFRARMHRCQDLVVIGGGFIGLETAAVARRRGCNVTVIESGDRLLARAVAPAVSDFYLTAHERRGTRVLLGAGVTSFEGEKGTVRRVVLADGQVLDADLVVVGIGAAPRLELARQLGLKCNAGIVVDEHARTSLPTVLAAGDCTETPHPLSVVSSPIRLESVQNAVDQAKCAAATIMGTPRAYSSVPWFWSDQDTLKLQIAGLSTGYDQTVQRGDPQKESFSILYYRKGSLVAVNAVNRPRDYMAVRRALAAGLTISPAIAADVSNLLRVE